MITPSVAAGKLPRAARYIEGIRSATTAPSVLRSAISQSPRGLAPESGNDVLYSNSLASWISNGSVPVTTRKEPPAILAVTEGKVGAVSPSDKVAPTSIGRLVPDPTSGDPVKTATDEAAGDNPPSRSGRERARLFRHYPPPWLKSIILMNYHRALRWSIILVPTPYSITSLMVLNWLLAVGSFSVVSIGVGQLFIPVKKPINYITSALGVSFGLAVLVYLLQSVGLYRNLPWLLYLYYPLELLTGTLLFFFFTLLVERDFPVRSPYLFLFLPVLITTALMMPYFLQDPATKIAQVPIYKTDNPFFHTIYLFIYHNLETWVIGNIALFLVRTGIYLRRKKIHWVPRLGTVLVFAGLFFVVLLLYIWVNLFPSEFARKVSILASLVIVYPLYFFQQRNLDLFGLSAAGEKQQRYGGSMKLAGVDIARVIERLDSLMTGEKLYTDSELSLAGLSEKLGVSPHQLSEILNARLETNFRQYINRFRIQAAMNIFRAAPDRSILDTAFDCGFGSKSAFNNAFYQIAGMTPREWAHVPDKDKERPPLRG